MQARVPNRSSPSRTHSGGNASHLSINNPLATHSHLTRPHTADSQPARAAAHLLGVGGVQILDFDLAPHAPDASADAKRRSISPKNSAPNSARTQQLKQLLAMPAAPVGPSAAVAASTGSKDNAQSVNISFAALIATNQSSTSTFGRSTPQPQPQNQPHARTQSSISSYASAATPLTHLVGGASAAASHPLKPAIVRQHSAERFDDANSSKSTALNDWHQQNSTEVEDNDDTFISLADKEADKRAGRRPRNENRNLLEIEAANANRSSAATGRNKSATSSASRSRPTSGARNRAQVSEAPQTTSLDPRSTLLHLPPPSQSALRSPELQRQERLAEQQRAAAAAERAAKDNRPSKSRYAKSAHFGLAEQAKKLKAEHELQFEHFDTEREPRTARKQADDSLRPESPKRTARSTSGSAQDSKGATSSSVGAASASSAQQEAKATSSSQVSTSASSGVSSHLNAPSPTALKKKKLAKSPYASMNATKSSTTPRVAPNSARQRHLIGGQSPQQQQ